MEVLVGSHGWWHEYRLSVGVSLGELLSALELRIVNEHEWILALRVGYVIGCCSVAVIVDRSALLGIEAGIGDHS